MSEMPEMIDVAVVGAGVSGIYALKKLRDAGFNTIAIESAPEIGGTWWFNSYPGIRVDIESIEFSYSFDPQLQQDWTWSRRYAPGEEVLRYLKYVVDRYALAARIRLSTRVDVAAFNERDSVWELQLSDGTMLRARHVVFATGLHTSAVLKPTIKGLDRFTGDVLESARWPKKGYDTTALKVGVIGTGATGVQLITALAPSLGDDLWVFQRTAHYVVPAHNQLLSPEYVAHVKAHYDQWRKAEQEHMGGFVSVDLQIDRGPTVSALDVSAEERHKEFERRWNSGGLSFYSSYPDLVTDPKANALLGEFLRAKIREQVAGYEKGELLVPRDFLPLTRRLVVEDGYYQSYTEHGANLVDIRDAQQFEVVAEGILVDGTLYELDTIILATGFESVTGPLTRFEIRGRGGITLQRYWGDRPRTLLGYMVHDFPNAFIVNALGCPGAFTQAFLLSEMQVDWITDLLSYARDRGYRCIEPSEAAQEAWTEHVADTIDGTLFPRTNSWYLAANAGGKPKPVLHLGGYPLYKRFCIEERERGYPSFAFDGEYSTAPPALYSISAAG